MYACSMCIVFIMFSINFFIISLLAMFVSINLVCVFSVYGHNASGLIQIND